MKPISLGLLIMAVSIVAVSGGTYRFELDNFKSEESSYLPGNVKQVKLEVNPQYAQSMPVDYIKHLNDVLSSGNFLDNEAPENNRNGNGKDLSDGCQNQTQGGEQNLKDTTDHSAKIFKTEIRVQIISSKTEQEESSSSNSDSEEQNEKGAKQNIDKPCDKKKVKKTQSSLGRKEGLEQNQEGKNECDGETCTHT
ncbi:uncharacterized protein LOC115758155 isoform X2 [Drosophila novamexicana]|uniref:uncharacterized protein LOC115758081 isoform X2 n=1 Tax=Drosophila novamexicana TaxID=47314 RepID=UPI0011E5B61E|nr:uncharacterized protein LOC115758081 isoform X2 [Drosophila novamexicana]XP_030554549.1 uncharacterized protein LOC115758155 isoform X2 [Drosophila novamexicana]